MIQRSYRSRARASKTDSRLHEVLQSLTQTFLKEGFLDLGVAEMAKSANCSKTTLYKLGPTKEQIQVAVIKAFFRNSAAQIEEQLDTTAPPKQQIQQYLTLISDVLSKATPNFFGDIDAFEPARIIYQNNTDIAAKFVHTLVTEALGERSHIDAAFVGAVAGQIMNAIHRGEIENTTGLDDSMAYKRLAQLISAAL